jgi:hypothetical protein
MGTQAHASPGIGAGFPASPFTTGLEKADELAHAACDEEPRAEEESIAFFFEADRRAALDKAE